MSHSQNDGILQIKCRELAKRIYGKLDNQMHSQRRSLTWAVELLLKTPAAFDLPGAGARTERVSAGPHKPRSGAPGGASTSSTQRSCYDFD
eukprot:324793-Pleurochrysis_carterae.AAC.1